jgi:hypothetical protein
MGQRRVGLWSLLVLGEARQLEHPSQTPLLGATLPSIPLYTGLNSALTKQLAIPRTSLRNLSRVDWVVGA